LYILVQVSASIYHNADAGIHRRSDPYEFPEAYLGDPFGDEEVELLNDLGGRKRSRRVQLYCNFGGCLPRNRGGATMSSGNVLHARPAM
jgi:hypothetical protein